MKRTTVLTAAAALLCLAACGEGPVTDDEEAAFLDVARDNVPGAANYSDDVLGGMASQVCSVLSNKSTSAADALDVMDNYESLTVAEQATVVGLAVGSACPENQDKVD